MHLLQKYIGAELEYDGTDLPYFRHPPNLLGCNHFVEHKNICDVIHGIQHLVIRW